MSRILVAIAASASFATLAESNTLKGQPGFFQPTPDGNSSISRIVPLEPPASQSVPVTSAESLARNPAPIARAEPAPERAKESEPDLDRALREHRELRQRSTAMATMPVAPGAYNGTTDERDR